MTPTNFWEERALEVLREEAPAVFTTLSKEGSLDAVVKPAVAAAIDRYAAMMEDGANADAAQEIAFADLRDHLLASSIH